MLLPPLLVVDVEDFVMVWVTTWVPAESPLVISV
jgi:hypothetical protein